MTSKWIDFVKNLHIQYIKHILTFSNRFFKCINHMALTKIILSEYCSRNVSFIYQQKACPDYSFIIDREPWRASVIPLPGGRGWRTAWGWYEYETLVYRERASAARQSRGGGVRGVSSRQEEAGIGINGGEPELKRRVFRQLG